MLQKGKKSTSFDVVCKALGVEFNLEKSGERVLLIQNTEQRVQDLKALIAATLEEGVLGKQSALVLRGKLGFADSFLHGRLGALLLKQLSEHAYGRTSKIPAELAACLSMMLHRLCNGRPREVNAMPLEQWYVYCDAAYEPESKTGGIGAVLFNCAGTCVSWFGFPLDDKTCISFGADKKHTIIYELELCAAILALDFWASQMSGGLQVCFGDNDAARIFFDTWLLCKLCCLSSDGISSAQGGLEQPVPLVCEGYPRKQISATFLREELRIQC